ncbi:MAG: MFS transporter [Bacteroidetes bacterium]|nr:MFS transporter [Bacteroidota bacterium]
MTHQPLSLKEKIGYGFGDAASSMFWKLFSMYLMFFYTDIFGIDAAIVGTMFLVTRIWDAAFDPVVGVIADRTASRYGKFRPYILWVAVPFGIAGVLTFSTPDLDVSGKIIYAYVTYSIMMMIYSLINVPYASLLGVMTADGRERTTLSSFRMVFAFLGSIIALALVDPLVKFFSETVQLSIPAAWQFTAAFFAALAVAFFWLNFAWTKERVQPIREEKPALKDDIRDLLGNWPWWILLGSGISALIFNSIRDGAAIYYFKYYVGDQSQVSLYFVLGQAFNIVGIVFVTPIAHKIGKKMTYMGAMAVATVLSIAFYWMDKSNLIGILVMQSLISVCAGSIFPLLWSMYADIADYSEWKTGRRATGLIFSSSSMSQKFGWTLGGALTGWLLAWFGFQANAVQSAEAQDGIKLMLSFFPAVGTVLSVIFILIYPLSEKKLAGITAELDQRRAEQNKSAD